MYIWITGISKSVGSPCRILPFQQRSDCHQGTVHVGTDLYTAFWHQLSKKMDRLMVGNPLSLTFHLLETLKPYIVRDHSLKKQPSIVQDISPLTLLFSPRLTRMLFPIGTASSTVKSPNMSEKPTRLRAGASRSFCQGYQGRAKFRSKANSSPRSVPKFHSKAAELRRVSTM